MGSKLYPPYIDGKVPAFFGGTSEAPGGALQVPFRHNRAVGLKAYSGMKCKLKTVSGNKFWILECNYNQIFQDPNTGNWYATFNLANFTDDNQTKTYLDELTVGLYYKIQLAYIDASDERVTGYFSDVGVTKFTTKPMVYIKDLQAGSNNNRGKQNYIGVYSQENGDTTEKVYSYHFVILDEAGNVFLDSGEKLHNSSFDTTAFESSDSFRVHKQFESNKKYRIQYSVTTINGLTATSGTYMLYQDETVKPALQAQLHADPYFNDGYIRVYLTYDSNVAVYGQFSICRSSSLDNFSSWEEMQSLTMTIDQPIQELFLDNTVEQGVQYCYSIQQFNTQGLYSNRIVSETVIADFEDMFLVDANRQLRVRFNPNVSSFKNDVIESKMDTIGGRYPFIFRNGTVKYKEFPISGLISYLSDEQEMFMKKEDLGALEFEGTDLTSENIRAERIFKLEVLNWLNNGEPKLFRSPSEGNYFVRLMNVSLSPNAQTGRMLHTFSATAYEIGENSLENLKAYDMFPIKQYIQTVMHFATINLHDDKYNTPVIRNYLGHVRHGEPYSQSTPTLSQLEDAISSAATPLDLPTIIMGHFENVAPGSIIGIQYKQNNETVVSYITIGRTEVYKINTKGNPIIAIYLLWTPAASDQFDGLFTYGYYSSEITDTFNEIAGLTKTDKVSQWIGKHNDIIKRDAYLDRNILDGAVNPSKISYNENSDDAPNGFVWHGLENFKLSTGRFYWMRFSVREIKDFYLREIDNELRLFHDDDALFPYLYSEIIDCSVYRDKDTNYYYDGRDIKMFLDKYEDNEEELRPYWYAKLTSNEFINNNNYYWTEDTKEPWDNSSTYEVDRLYKFAINHVDQNVDLKNIGRYELSNIDNITSISMGRMLILDCYYSTNEILYSVETDWPANSEPNQHKNEYYTLRAQINKAIGADDSGIIADDSMLVSDESFDASVAQMRKYWRLMCSDAEGAIGDKNEEQEG